MATGGAAYDAAGTLQLPVRVRRLLMLVPPLLLAVLEILHPQPDFNARSLMDASTWFAVFHVIQLVLTGLVGLSVLLLADGYGRATTWATRLGLGTFLVFFSAYETLAGIGTGLAMRGARDLTAAQQEAVFDLVKDWPGLGPVFVLGIVGTGGLMVVLGALAAAARRQGAPRREWITLALATVFLLAGHPFPGGTLAFGCLFLAALFHERTVSNMAGGQRVGSPAPSADDPTR